MKNLGVFLFIVMSIVLVSCGKKPVKAEPPKPAKPLTKLDRQFKPVFEVSKYLQHKYYSGNAIYYTSVDMRPPNSVDTNIAYLSEEGVSFTKVLRCEILARHHYLFTDDAVIQRIFNFTFWYDQHKAKTLRYDETTLNAFERENLRRLGKVLNEGYDIHYWDGLKTDGEDDY